MKSYGFVYISTNRVNGKRYIGQTHYDAKAPPTYYGSGKAIKMAIKKYGVNSFERVTIFEAFSKEHLNWAERHFICEYNAVASDEFYNIAPGGRASLGFTGKQHSKERNASVSKNMLENHPRSIKVFIDGKYFSTLKKAYAGTEYTHAELRMFISDGIHPLDQRLSKVSKPRSYAIKPPSAKYWKIQTENGIIDICNLSKWCRDNSINYGYLRETLIHGNPYCGYRILSTDI